MLDRFERPLKIICLGLAALLVFQVANVLFRGDPLAAVKIPALPSLPGATNETDKLAKHDTNAPDGKKASTNGTNATIAGAGTNGTNGANATNAGITGGTASATNKGATNIVKGTNAPSATNAVKHGELARGNGTNRTNRTDPTNQTNATPATTNAIATSAGHTNAGKPHLAGGPPGMPPDMMAAGMPGMPGRSGGRRGGGGGAKPVTLPADVQARVDRIIESEILGPTARPVPMALMGIADDEAFLRATNGQIGPVKIGGEMAGIKVLRIALNRVLVEQDGEKKELTLFGGTGSESLLPKTPEPPSTNSQAANLQSTNALSTNSPAAKHRKGATENASTNLPHSSQQKEAP